MTVAMISYPIMSTVSEPVDHGLEDVLAAPLAQVSKISHCTLFLEAHIALRGFLKLSHQDRNHKKDPRSLSSCVLHIYRERG